MDRKGMAMLFFAVLIITAVWGWFVIRVSQLVNGQG